MDAGEALRDHDPEAEIARRRGGMLARGALTVVFTGDYGMPRLLPDGASAIDISRVDAFE